MAPYGTKIGGHRSQRFYILKYILKYKIEKKILAAVAQLSLEFQVNVLDALLEYQILMVFSVSKENTYHCFEKLCCPTVRKRKVLVIY